jgi:hypothetical protein
MSNKWQFPKVETRRSWARRGIKRHRILSFTTSFLLFASLGIAAASWTATIGPAASAKGYGKSKGLPTAFIDTVNVSASLTGTLDPDTAGNVSIQFSSSSPFAIHLSGMAFAGGTYGDPVCGVTIFNSADRTQPLDVTLPANGTSSVITFPNILDMAAGAPESCANTVFEIPVSDLVGTRV